MTILTMLLRQKQIDRSERHRELAELCSRSEAAERALLAARHVHGDARTTLRNVLGEADLCIQRLQLAQASEQATHRELELAADTHARLTAELDQARKELSLIEKEVEKLNERIAEARQQRQLQQSMHAMHELEDWVLGTRGRAS